MTQEAIFFSHATPEDNDFVDEIDDEEPAQDEGSKMTVRNKLNDLSRELYKVNVRGTKKVWCPWASLGMQGTTT